MWLFIGAGAGGLGIAAKRRKKHKQDEVFQFHGEMVFVGFMGSLKNLPRRHGEHGVRKEKNSDKIHIHLFVIQ
jgi:hypothetical protein